MAREQQLVARDFLGLTNIGDAKEKGESKDGDMPLKLHEVDLGHLSGASSSINNGIFFNNMSFAGLKHPLRSRVASFQQVFAPANLPEEKFVEQSAESIPERSYLPFPHPVQAWWQGDLSVKSDEHGARNQVMGGFAGLGTKSTLPLPAPNLHTHAGYLNEVQLRMLPSKPTEMKHSAPLTIFYGGNVNVFNDITEEKAQAIMLLASAGNFPGVASSDVPNTGPINVAMASANAPNTSAANLAMASTIAPSITAINLASGSQMDQKNCFQVENAQQVVTNPSCFGSTSMQLDFGHAGVPNPPSQEQPVVPTALPQARKASLARFLEKRRERVSKSPYPLKQAADSSLPEERFSSSNDIALARPYSSNKEERKKVSLPSWMERLPDFSDTVAKEDIKIVSV